MDKKFLRVEDIMQELGVSKSYAYRIIHQLNEELKEKGFITVSGRVNRKYFLERLYGSPESGNGVKQIADLQG